MDEKNDQSLNGSSGLRIGIARHDKEGYGELLY